MKAPTPIESKLTLKGWTPGKGEILSLVEAWPTLSEALQKKASTAIAGVDSLALNRLLHNWQEFSLSTKQEVARFVTGAIFKNSSLSDGEKNIRWLMTALTTEQDTRVRKGFVQGIGAALQGEHTVLKMELIDTLLECSKSQQGDPAEARALVEALGKSADSRAIAQIEALSQRYYLTDDKSRLILSRDLARADETPGTITSQWDQLVKVAPSADLLFSFTPGVDVLARRSGEFGAPERVGEGILRVDLSSMTARKKELLGSNRLWRESSIVLTSIESAKRPTSAELVEILVSHEKLMRSGLSGLSENCKVRVRVDRACGMTRSEVWEFANILSTKTENILCDGRDAHWELQILQGSDRSQYVSLQPLTLQDDRWSWRQGKVEGSSQGALAAALAYLADVKITDEVWDPFCGAGTELIEACFAVGRRNLQLQPAPVKIFGTDIDPEALGIFQDTIKNLKLKAEARCESALDVDGRYDVIVTNPPFGMRSARGEARQLLETFFGRVKLRLKARGRFVLLSHAPSGTAEWGRNAGLKLIESIPLKLDGMRCELQRFE